MRITNFKVLTDTIIISWEGSKGFGEYTFFKKNDKWLAYSEYMDNNDDKSFANQLFAIWLKEVGIIDGRGN